ncbi:ADP-ribosylglycohydrolase family protein [Parafrankia sp. BMG5.11]|uniref:ADP-ribosylglycohydrolase family protein n=1 Tax=Parafrankia sp. BMG5.11 TaxID=222540 RepID=UPI001A9D4B87|nr:ADP-ribosylglycohydrolase family protein [Parafrankia sp. BMG5.11]
MRDLQTDVAAIAKWGAAAVVTLLEPHEIAMLSVASLGAEVERQHMAWIHLPIRDVSVPIHEFEQDWQVQGARLRAILRSGFDVVVHCKGGLGRAGMIAARLLVELGTPPDEAIKQVRTARPGAIETGAQEAHVQAAEYQAEPVPSAAPEAVRDRALGALLGLAVGDALGTTLEFTKRDGYEPLSDMIGGGPFRLQPGQWTDDTAMALALADSLIAHPELDPADLMARFGSWREEGTYSCSGSCFDIGSTVSSALHRWQRTGNPVAGSTDPHTAGNGALMRLAPVALRWWHDQDMVVDVAVRQSATTHGAPEALSASAAFATMLGEAIAGHPRSQVLAPRSGDYAGNIAPIMAGSWRGKPRHQVQSSGYVTHSLEAALWAVGRTGSFRDAVLLAANLGGDADTTAAITGQLAGALYGLRGIPEEWLSRLAWRERIEEMGKALFEADQLATATNRQDLAPLPGKQG